MIFQRIIFVVVVMCQKLDRHLISTPSHTNKKNKNKRNRNLKSTASEQPNSFRRVRTGVENVNERLNYAYFCHDKASNNISSKGKMYSSGETINNNKKE